ncbi:MAG: hypothetical protein ACPGXZ_14135, partial [Saprospiraceae bacterium]
MKRNFLNLICLILLITTLINCNQVDNSTPEKLLTTWNNAINNHDWETLKTLYSNEVDYYAKKKKIEDILSLKKSYLEKNPNFKQSVSLRSTIETYYNSVTVKFDKSYKNNASIDTTFSTLSLIKGSQGWKIINETDIETQIKNHKRICDCKDFWYFVMVQDDNFFFKNRFDRKDAPNIITDFHFDRKDHTISYQILESLESMDHASNLAIYQFQIQTKELLLFDRFNIDEKKITY